MSDSLDYLNKQEEELRIHEAQCKRCGICCGAPDNDPCSRLARSEDGRYFCSVYQMRLGPQATVSGRQFMCVNITDVLKFGAPPSRDCGYGQAPSLTKGETDEDKCFQDKE